MRRQIRYVAWHMEDARAAKNDEMLTGPIRLPGQMHAYVASSDPEIRERP
jgi:hypothetical protein